MVALCFLGHRDRLWSIRTLAEGCGIVLVCHLALLLTKFLAFGMAYEGQVAKPRPHWQ
jgi:hypothetical protein